MSERNQAGGAATHAGTDYQNRASAWLSIRILAEQDASPPWDLPSSVTLDLIRCESDQPVDDILVGLSSGGFAFLQAKHAVTLSAGIDSDLGKTLDQFVRQYLRAPVPGYAAQPWDRPLDPERDRLVLLAGRCSEPIRSDLPSLLIRLRGLTDAQHLAAAALTDGERRALKVVQDHISHFWNSVAGSPPREADVRALLRLIRVHVLDVDPGQAGEREAKDLLRSAVLADPTQADLAWTELLRSAALCARGQTGADRRALQHGLRDAGVSLKTPRSYQPDMERLRGHTEGTLSRLAEYTRILIGTGRVQVDRTSTHTLTDAARQGSLVVVGEPGAGKSGALHDAARALIREGRQVVALAAEQLSAGSPGLLRQELGLSHELPEVLGQWHGAEAGILFIDALDALRTEAGARTLRDLVRSVRALPHWHVVVSIRKFDLRHSPPLQSLFPAVAQPPDVCQDPEFRAVRHLSIPLLDQSELDQVTSQSTDLAGLMATANPDLTALLRVPFNLRLAGELLGLGAGVAELKPVRTQIELLDRYWQHRVIGDDANGYGREAVLEKAVQVMVAARAIRVQTRDVVAQNPTVSGPLTEVLHAHVLVEWQPTPGAPVDRNVLTFSHHILYDYAVERLMLRGLPERLVALLEADPDLVIAVRPSLVLHFQYQWLRDGARSLFWQLVFSVLKSPRVPEIGKVIGLGVAAEMMSAAADLQALSLHLECAAPADRQAGEQALRYLVQTLLTTPSPAREEQNVA